MGRALSAPPLIEEDDPIPCWIEELPVRGFDPAARATVNKQGRLAIRIPALFKVDSVKVGDLQSPGTVGIDRWEDDGICAHSRRVRRPHPAVNGFLT